MTAWLQALLRGDRRVLAQIISQIENDEERAREALAALYPHSGRAYRVGVTGASGTGKSTLVNALTGALRRQGRTVGVVAVDPTSPFTGGALLGDRIRMRDLAGDPGVFIRSMASRGELGGLARATADVVVALDAAGFDVVLIETVGAGQGEVEIARAAHTTVVVEAAGLGDGVQALKAGLLEVADVVVVNKADRPGAEATARALRATLESGASAAGPALWRPPVVQTVATEGTGAEALLSAIDAHRAYLAENGLMAERERKWVEAEIARWLRDALLDRLMARTDPHTFNRLVEQVLARQLDPHSAAIALLTPPAEGRKSGSGVE